VLLVDQFNTTAADQSGMLRRLKQFVKGYPLVGRGCFPDSNSSLLNLKEFRQYGRYEQLPAGRNAALSQNADFEGTAYIYWMSMATEWKASSTSEGLFEGVDRGTGEIKWTAHRCGPSLRFQLSAPGHRGHLRIGRLEGDLREGLRSCVE
jgi:hypothetical protein